MKKRVFALVVAVAGLVLLLNASAWADGSYALEKITTGYEALYDVENRLSENLRIRIRAEVNYSASESDQRSNNAAILEVKVEADDDVVGDLKLSSKSGQNNTPITVRFNLSPSKTYYDATLTGKIAGEGDITVTATLLQSNGGKATTGKGNDEILTQDEEIELSAEDGVDVYNDDFGSDPYDVPSSDSSGTLDDGPSDPIGTNTNWIGEEPPLKAGSQLSTTIKPSIKTSKPSFKKSGASAKAGTADSFVVEIDGPSPTVDVYVAAKDAKKLWPLSKDAFTSDISLTRTNILTYKLPFRVVSFDFNTSTDQDKKTKHYVTIAYNGANVSYKGFPLTVSAANSATTGKKPVTKTYKIGITSTRAVPQWVTMDGIVGENLKNPDTGKDSKNAENIVVRLDYSGRKVPSTSYTVSADAPYVVEAKGAKDGVTAEVYQPELNRYGEVVTPGYVVVGGIFTESKVTDGKGHSKEAKTTVTLNATASVKKTGFKATAIGKVSPYFEKTVTVGDEEEDEEVIEYLSGIKRVETGTVPNVKFSAKGSKVITYTIDDDSLEALNEVNLSFDCAKGTVVALKKNGVAQSSLPTITGDEFESIDIAVTANNGTGKKATVHAEVGVTGGKPTLNSTSGTLAIPKNAEEGDEFVISCDVARIHIDNENTNNKIKYSLATTADKQALAELGLELVDDDELDDDEYRNCGVFRVGEDGIKKATKGTTVNLLLDNYGAQNKGKVKIVITDPAPEIDDPDESSVSLSARTSEAVKTTISLSLTEESKPTSSTAKMEWKATMSKSTKAVKATIKANGKKDNDPYGAVLTLTVPKNYGKKSGQDDFDGEVTITAKNKENGLSDTVTISVAVAAVDEVDKARSSAVAGRSKAAPEAPAEAEAGTDGKADTSGGEASVVFGAPRTEANLTAGQMSFIQSKGYTVIAVLPELTAETDGQTDIPVELDEDAPKGAKLVYLPFAQDGGSEDDDIVDFYGEDGAPIEEVPAGKAITIAPWLRAGVTYQPIIAAESK